MALTFKIRPEAGSIPFDEVDITTRSGPYEGDPADYDAKARSSSGRLTRVLRGMGRQFIFSDIQNLTASEVQILRAMKMNRTRVALSPNWNENTLLYARYSRNNRATSRPESVYGVQPTFARTIASANASCTQRREDGRFDLIAANVARFEQSNPGNTLYPALGLRPYGKHKNYFGQSHPKSGALVWSLTNFTGAASWVWDANLPRMVTDASSGSGRFIGRITTSPDYISYVVAAYDAAAIISVGVWVMGEGTFSLQLTGGAVAETANTVLSPNTWTLLKLEGVTASGAAVTVRLNSRATASWCAVGGAQFNASARLLGYVHNIANTTVYQVGNDDLSYDIQVPVFATTIHLGLEMPDLVVSGEQCILGVDQGGGNRLVLRYRGAANKFSFHKTSTGTAVAEWTPAKAAGQGTIISISAVKDSLRVYENGIQMAAVASGIVEPIPRGLHVGWDGVTGNEDEGWNGLIYFLRIDSSPLDLGEIAYINGLWNDPQQILWTKALEGRLFEITTPVHRIKAGMNFSSLELEQVDAIYGATHEVP